MPFALDIIAPWIGLLALFPIISLVIVLFLFLLKVTVNSRRPLPGTAPLQTAKKLS
jgi:hypothetical protein